MFKIAFVIIICGCICIYTQIFVYFTLQNINHYNEKGKEIKSIQNYCSKFDGDYKRHANCLSEKIQIYEDRYGKIP